MTSLRGVLPMLVTPFDAQGNVAEDELHGLVEYQLAAGVGGLSILGLAAEAGMLTEDERLLVTRRVLAVAGESPVVVGCSAPETAAAVRLAIAGAEEGAAAVMIAPPERPDWDRDALHEHYASVADAVAPAPVMVQDAPAFIGVALDPRFVLELAASHENVIYAKPESVPAADAVAELSRLDGVGVFGGHGGLYMLEVLEAGADGVIPGCDQPTAFQDIFDAWDAADHDGARERFERLLPLLAWQFQSLDCFIAAVKALLCANGIIGHPSLRGRRWPLGRPSMEILLRHAARVDEISDRRRA